jgi:hypothetical protein
MLGGFRKKRLKRAEVKLYLRYVDLVKEEGLS